MTTPAAPGIGKLAQSGHIEVPAIPLSVCDVEARPATQPHWEVRNAVVLAEVLRCKDIAECGRGVSGPRL